jgi:hypothetical protein
MSSITLQKAVDMFQTGPVLVFFFGKNVTFEDAIGSNACLLEALAGV